MKRLGPKAELAALKRSIKELEAKFLAPYPSSSGLRQPSREEELDVAAFVVLVHGALENFVEGLAYWLLSHGVDHWTQKKRSSRCTVSLALYRPSPGADTNAGTVFDNVRVALKEAKEGHSRAIQENNGVGVRHLRSLFYPLGLDIPSDPVLTASLEMLIAMRHHWAHQFRFGANVVKSAEDARVAVSDCVKFAEQLSAGAAAVRP